MLLPTRVLRKDWGRTLKLPKSTFPPRPIPEDQQRYLKRSTDDLYRRQSSDDSRPPFVLHDGPPYANGSLHIGHALNKILKDFICRFQVLEGKRVQYIPGWDCHGLPIETKALQQNPELREALATGSNPSDYAVAIRKAARKLAADTVEEQKAGFKQWAVMGDWDKAWLTMDKGFELRQLEMFQKMVEKGEAHLSLET
jgi:isoleucyl-tRNA synthetase